MEIDKIIRAACIALYINKLENGNFGLCLRDYNGCPYSYNIFYRPPMYIIVGTDEDIVAIKGNYIIYEDDYFYVNYKSGILYLHESEYIIKCTDEYIFVQNETEMYEYKMEVLMHNKYTDNTTHKKYGKLDFFDKESFNLG